VFECLISNFKIIPMFLFEICQWDFCSLCSHPITALFTEVLRNSRGKLLTNDFTTSTILFIHSPFPVCSLYLIPAFLYSLYNNIAFLSLSAFDPTTYYLLLQLRVALTGVVYQVTFFSMKYFSVIASIMVILFEVFFKSLVFCIRWFSRKD